MPDEGYGEGPNWNWSWQGSWLDPIEEEEEIPAEEEAEEESKFNLSKVTPPDRADLNSAVKSREEGDALSRSEAAAVAAMGLGMNERKDRAELQTFFNRHGFKVDPAVTAWCATYMNAVLAESGGKGTGSDIATSFLKWGKPVDYNQAQAGDIAVEHRGRGAYEVGGHVGMLTGNKQVFNGRPHVEVIAGNTEQGVTKYWMPASKLAFRTGGTAGGRQSAAADVPIETEKEAGVPANQRAPITDGRQRVFTDGKQADKRIVWNYPTEGEPGPLFPRKTKAPQIETVRTAPATAEAVQTQRVPAPVVAPDPIAVARQGPGGSTAFAPTVVPSPVPSAVPPVVVRPPLTPELPVPPGPVPMISRAMIGGAVPSVEGDPFDPVSNLDVPVPRARRPASRVTHTTQEPEPDKPAAEPEEPVIAGDPLAELLREQERLDSEYRQFPIDTELPIRSPVDTSADVPVDEAWREPTEADTDLADAWRDVPLPTHVPPGGQWTGPAAVMEEPTAPPRGTLDTLTSGLRELDTGLLKGLGRVAYGLPMVVSRGASQAGKLLKGAITGEDVSQEKSPADTAAEFFEERLRQSERGAHQLMQTPEIPQNELDRIMRTTGQTFGETVTMPVGMGGLTVPMLKAVGVGTPLIAAGQSILEPTAAEAQRASKAEKAQRAKEARDAATPGMIEGGNISFPTERPMVNINAYVIPTNDGRFQLIPGDSHFGKLSLPRDAAIKQFDRYKLHHGIFDSEEAAMLHLKNLNDSVPVQVPSAAGPQKISNGELKSMGMLAAATVGLMFAPRILTRFNAGMGRLRPVGDAAPNTYAFTTRLDLARSADDVTAPITNVARRIGLDARTVTEIRTAQHTQTRGAASNVASAAIHLGQAETPNFTFRVNTPAARLHEIERATPELAEYLHLGHQFDELQSIRRTGIAARAAGQPTTGPGAGPPMIRGMTDADVLARRNALERANPQLRQLEREYQQNLYALRNFERRGEYGTMTPNQYRTLAAERPHEIYWDQGTTGTAPIEAGLPSPTQLLADEMHSRIRARIENETTGFTIDTMRRQDPRTFVRVTQEELAANPHWRKNTVSFYRRGVREYYTTDPMLAQRMKMDPYWAQTSPTANLLTLAPLRLQESMTTGRFAPWFADTSAIRSHQIIRMTAPTTPTRSGVQISAPNVLQTAAAIPQQWGSAAIGGFGESLRSGWARSIAGALDRSSGGYITRAMGPGWVDAAASRVLDVFHDSLYFQMMRGGTHGRAFYDAPQQYRSILDQALENARGPLRTFLNGWDATFGAIHSAPTYAMARRNLPGRRPHFASFRRNPTGVGATDVRELSQIARSITGDPNVSGQFWFGGRRGHGWGEAATYYDPSQGILGRAGTRLAQGYGALAEAGRFGTQWFNITQQGMKAIGAAYMRDPIGFVTRAMMFQSTPAAAAFFWNRALGNDPRGRSYSEYQMYGRSSYNTLMNLYIAKPGAPVEDGIQLPRVHELAWIGRATEALAHHLVGATYQGKQMYNPAQDFMDIAKNYVNVVTPQAIHPLFQAYDAARGLASPRGYLEGRPYRPREEAFDQNRGLPVSIELMMKAFGGALGDVAGAGAGAIYQGNKKDIGFGETVKAGLGEAGKRALSKSVVGRELFDQRPPAAGNTRMNEEMHENFHFLGEMEKHWKRYGETGGDKRFMKMKPRSKEGGEIARQRLGEPLPERIMGLAQPRYENPLWEKYAQLIHQRFFSDVPAKGGMGFLSVRQRLGHATDQLSSLNAVSDATHSTWMKQIEDTPGEKEWLAYNGVDYRDKRAVRNHFERVRQDATAEILWMMKGVENEISKKEGRTIRLKDLAPYNLGEDIEDYVWAGESYQ